MLFDINQYGGYLFNRFSYDDYFDKLDTSRNGMVIKLDNRNVRSKIDYHWVLYTPGFVPHLR